MTTFFAYCLTGGVSACYLLAMHTVALCRTARGTARPCDRRRLQIASEKGRGTLMLMFAVAWPIILVTWPTCD